MSDKLELPCAIILSLSDVSMILALIKITEGTTHGERFRRLYETIDRQCEQAMQAACMGL